MTERDAYVQIPVSEFERLTTQARESERTRDGWYLAQQALRSLNDVVSELVCGLATGDELTRGYAYTVVKTLAKQTRALGGEPSVTPEQIAYWEHLA